MNATKQKAGKLGGLRTVEKHGKEHMQEIGRRGAAATWRKYALMPVDSSGYAMVERSTGKIRAIWCAPWIVLILLFLAACTPFPTRTPTETAAAISSPTMQATNTARPAGAAARAALSPTPARCVVSTGYQAGTVNVRSGPGMSFPVVDVVSEGQLLPLYGQPSNGWQRVTTPALVDGYFYVSRWCAE